MTGFPQDMKPQRDPSTALGMTGLTGFEGSIERVQKDDRGKARSRSGFFASLRMTTRISPKRRPSSRKEHGTITIRGRIRCNVAAKANRDFGDVPVGRRRADGDAARAGAPSHGGVPGRAGPAG